MTAKEFIKEISKCDADATVLISQGGKLRELDRVEQFVPPEVHALTVILYPKE